MGEDKDEGVVREMLIIAELNQYFYYSNIREIDEMWDENEAIMEIGGEEEEEVVYGEMRIIAEFDGPFFYDLEENDDTWDENEVDEDYPVVVREE